jgi:hypothetical protein
MRAQGIIEGKIRQEFLQLNARQSNLRSLKGGQTPNQTITGDPPGIDERDGRQSLTPVCFKEQAEVVYHTESR